jgi:hypothetical protein
MADTKFTLLEFHLRDGAVRLGSRTAADGATGAATGSASGVSGGDSDADGDDAGERLARTAGKLLLLVGGLVVLAVAVSKLLGGGENIEELEELEELPDPDE